MDECDFLVGCFGRQNIGKGDILEPDLFSDLIVAKSCYSNDLDVSDSLTSAVRISTMPLAEQCEIDSLEY
jgi:hypothetical protein